MEGYHREQITNFSCLRRTKGAIGLEPSETNSVVAKKVQPGVSRARSSIMPQSARVIVVRRRRVDFAGSYYPCSGLYTGQKLTQYARIHSEAASLLAS